MDANTLNQLADQLLNQSLIWISSPIFYSQLGLIFLALTLAYSLSSTLKRFSPALSTPPKAGRLLLLRKAIYNISDLMFPLFNILLLVIMADASIWLLQKNEIVRVAQGMAVVLMIYSVNTRFVSSPYIRALINLVIIPAALLEVMDLLTPIIQYLESLKFELGNINISLYGVVRVLIFGTFLFWLGRLSNQTGQKLIRQQQQWDNGTREIFAKLYQVALILIIFLLLLQIMGINLTALAVFGGALGVGLGFGLQSIASNFISGMIIIMERSLALGDYIEMSDGRKGTIREMNMRSTTIETFDGKDIMIPNEQFITTSFTNWTHKNKKQRYSIEFQVAYSTDLHKLFDLLREVVARHPKVISGPDIPFEERPDAEIAGFEDSGVKILIEFWMEGIDDGENRVGGDLYLMIWDALKEHQIQIPFPQREVKIIQMAQG